MKIAELVAAAMERAEIASHRQLGDRIGVSHTSIGQWLKGERFPTFEAAAALASLAGMPVTTTAAAVRLETPEGKKHRAILRKIASAAALLMCMALPFSIPTDANAFGRMDVQTAKCTPDRSSIMSN